MRWPGLLVPAGLVVTGVLALAACTGGETGVTPAAPTATPAPVTSASPPTATVAPPTVTPAPPTPTASATVTPTPRPSATPAPVPALPTRASAGPEVLSFSVAPVDGVAVGDGVTATWEATGERAELCLIGAQPAFCREVPLSGSTAVTIEEQMLAYPKLGLRASAGQDFTWSIVDLHYRCTEGWFFADHPSSCPQAPVHAAAAAQYFEHGFMVWTETPDRFYVFYDDGELIRFDGPYIEQSPDEDVGEPPAGLYEPVSGFGKVWHGELGGLDAESVRRRLGWATAPEFPYEADMQCAIPSHPHLWQCYLRGPDGRVLYVHPDSSAQVRLLWQWW